MRKIGFALAALAAVLLAAWLLWARGSGEPDGADPGGLAGPGAHPPATAPDGLTGVPGPRPAARQPGETPPLDAPVRPEEGAIELFVTAGGKAVSGAEVRLYWRGPADPNTNAIDWRTAGEAATGADGLARLPARPGLYLASARAAGYAPARREVDRPSGEAVTRAELALARGGLLRGRAVAKGSGEPVALARVDATFEATVKGSRADAPPEERAYATADTEGRFELAGLAPGHYAVRASAPGYARAETRASAPGEVTLELVGASFIQGFVRDASGGPAPGATVTATGGTEDAVSAVSNARGGYALEVAPGSWQVTARRGEEAGVHPGRVAVAAGQTTSDVEVKLGAGASIAGTVTAAGDGSPVAGAEVLVSPYLENGDTGRAATGPDGRYRVGGLAPASYDVDVRAPGFTPALHRGVTLASGATFPLDVKLDTNGAVEGTVSEEDGTPIAGALVRARQTTPAEARTGADGRYRLARVENGRVLLYAQRSESGPAAAQPVDVKAGETAHADFTLADAGAIEGVVRNADGSPIAKPALVLAFPRRNRVNMYGDTNQTETDATGHFRVACLPGAWTVFARDESRRFNGYRDGAVVDVEAGRTAHRDLALAPEASGYELSGLVLEPNGAASPGAFVMLRAGGLRQRVVLAATAGPDGRFDFSSDSPFPTPAALTARNGARAGEAAVPLDGGEVNVQLQAGAVLDGTLTGRPVATFELSFAGLDSTWSGGPGALTFAGNAFHLPEVAPGTTHLHVKTDDGRTGDADVVLTAGRTTNVAIALTEASTVRGRVVDAGREPLAGALVSILGVDANWQQTGADGLFTLSGLSPGPQTVQVWRSGYESERRTVTPQPGVPADLGDIALAPQKAPPGTIGVVFHDTGDGPICFYVMQDGPAWSAGVRDGDLVAAVDGQPMKSASEAAAATYGTPGSPVALSLRRNGSALDLTVTRAQ